MNDASRLRLAEIRDGKARYVEYVTDELGQVVYKKQLFAISGQTGGPHEVTYRFGGHRQQHAGAAGDDRRIERKDIPEARK